MMMKRIPVRLLQILCCCLLFVFFAACSDHKEKTVDIDNFEFTTTDATELYFKNMRESYYDVEEREGIKIYRFEEYGELDSFLIKPVIVYHWRTDRAFLMLEFDPSITNDEIILSDSTGERSYSPGQMRDYLKIAYDIEKVLAADLEPQLLLNGRKIPVFYSDKEKSYFSLVLYDFFRFTNTY